MKKIVWLGFAFFLSVLRALPADGNVVVKKPGEKVRLLCGLPAGGSLVWYHQESMVVRVDGKTGMTQRGKVDISSRATVRQMTLEIQSVKETDAGMFTCKTSGISEQHLLILMTVSASPSTVLKLGSSATLQCQVKGPIPEPEVQWRKPDGSVHSGSKVAHLESVAHSDAGAWNCTFSYDGKPYSERLDISVTEPAPAPVTPRAGSKEPTCKDCGASTPPVPPPLLLLGLSWWLWVVIGVGCLIVVVLMFFVIYLCKRIQRKKRKLKRMENSRQLLMAKQYCQCNRPTAAPKLQQRRLREKPSTPPLQPLLVQ